MSVRTVADLIEEWHAINVATDVGWSCREGEFAELLSIHSRLRSHLIHYGPVLHGNRVYHCVGMDIKSIDAQHNASELPVIA